MLLLCPLLAGALPARAQQPAQPAQSAQPAQPAHSAQPAQGEQSGQSAQPAAAQPGAGLIGLDLGYFDMYDLRFADAHRVFGAWMTAHPGDPLGPASDAAAFLFSEFERLQVLDLELFADPDKFDARGRPTPDETTRRNFDQRAAQADALADAILKNHPNDPDALYSKTLMCGMRANYAALIDKKDYTALKWTEQGSKLAKETLDADPRLYDAYIAVGVENYVLSLKPGILKFFLALRGDGTSKEEGIRQLTLCAEKGHFLAPFARMMLAVADMRDGKVPQARQLLNGLSEEFPQNDLYKRQLQKLR